MINEAITCLEQKFFTTQVGTDCSNQKLVLDKTRLCADDLSPIEVFYASTTSTAGIPSKSTPDSSLTFVVDKDKERARVELETQLATDESIQTKEIEQKQAAEQHKQFLKAHIDAIVGNDSETQPLSRYLYRHMRTKATVDRLQEEREEHLKGNRQVQYVSSSFLVDGVYPLAVSVMKKKTIRSLRTNHFINVQPEAPSSVTWGTTDGDRPLVGVVFNPITTSTIYEDNLQRILLTAAFKLEETQKLDPRGALLTYMAMFAPEHDPVIEVSLLKPTTLRGLFSNVLDGKLYQGYSIASLPGPFTTCDLYEGDDQQFCDRVLLCSYYSVYLTLLGVKVWSAGRYPDDRFATDTNGFVTIKLPKGEVIYDEQDGVWIFAKKHKKQICYVTSFISLIACIYQGETGISGWMVA